MKRLLLVGVLLVFAVVVSAQEKRNLTVQEFKSKLESTPDAVLLDVRTPEEVRKGSIANATNIDFFGKGFDEKIENLDKGKTYFVYCAGGSRSGETMELMEKLGFKKIYNLKDGFNAWKEKKMPVKN